jgi:hypothetical protein
MDNDQTNDMEDSGRPATEEEDAANDAYYLTRNRRALGSNRF